MGGQVLPDKMVAWSMMAYKLYAHTIWGVALSAKTSGMYEDLTGLEDL